VDVVERGSSSSTSSVLSTSSACHCPQTAADCPTPPAAASTGGDTPAPARPAGCRTGGFDLLALHEAMSSSLRHAVTGPPPPPVTDLLTAHHGPTLPPSDCLPPAWIFPPPPPSSTTGRGSYDWAGPQDVKTPHAFTARAHIRESRLLIVHL